MKHASGFGPNPWQQLAWDWRAAGNFMAGGAGGGLIVFAALSGALGRPAPAQFACGSALVAFGLVCVWLEIGRPWRALHVFFNPRRSWMSREAILATLLLPCAVAAALGVPGAAPLAAVLALAFVYAQARILRAAKGIPAWRTPALVPLVVATGLAEGAGLFLFSSLPHGTGSVPIALLAAGLIATRWLLWRRYRLRLVAAPPALAALDAAARPLLWFGTAAPLALIAAALALAALAGGAIDAGTPALAAGLAGINAVLAGAWFKLVLITRAAFNQGFALARLPVRGAAG
jgi:phenylacetyl-CoA:acceptor oxidoreductase 26-kDa subunit